MTSLVISFINKFFPIVPLLFATCDFPNKEECIQHDACEWNGCYSQCETFEGVLKIRILALILIVPFLYMVIGDFLKFLFCYNKNSKNLKCQKPILFAHKKNAMN